MSSRALGAMVKGMGGAKFDELLNWLMETLKCEQSSVDQSGAAQGTPFIIIQSRYHVISVFLWIFFFINKF